MCHRALHSAISVAALLILADGPAASQEAEELASRDGIAEAASELGEKGEDALLLKDLLDQEIEGSDGETIGTVRDFVILPGGRLIAAIVDVDETRIAIPFGAVKLAGSADDVG